MSRKNAAGVEVDDTASDTPAIESTPVIAAPAASATEETPSEGGSYMRQPDGSLIRNTDGGRNG